MIKLVIKSGPHEGRVFVPPPGGEVSIGRSKDCFVSLDSGQVSRKHAVLSSKGDGYEIRDAGSRNGTHVNGVKVARQVLRSGDTIGIGEFQIAYLVEEDDPWIGKVVAGHRILEKLGAGGMGTVYRAHQVAMDRTVALKILSEALGKNEAFVARFVDEARAMAKVSHPHVVQVHNVGQHQGTFFLSMEYLEGGSLKDLLDREGALPPKRAISLVLDATEALVWAEQRGIVHRDLKPGNLLLGANGRVKVGDFGLAADLRRDESSRDEGQILGSPHFMAPEQALGKPVNHRADIYALGSTLYVALSRRNPFPGRGVKEVILAKVKGEPIPISKVAPGVPPALERVLAKAMARNPEDRHGSAKELRDELSAVLKSLSSPAAAKGSGASPKGGAAPARRAPARRHRDHGPRLSGAKVLGCIAAASAIGGLMVWAFVGRSPRQDEAVFGEKGTLLIADGVPSRGTSGAGEASEGKTLGPPPPPRGGERNDATPSASGQDLTGPGRPDPALPEPAPRGSPPTSASPLPEGLLAEVDILVLEGRFQDARALLEQKVPQASRTSEAFGEETRRIAAAETLFAARAKALELERAQSYEEAKKELERVAEGLPEPQRTEAQKAVEAIEARAKGSL